MPSNNSNRGWTTCERAPASCCRPLQSPPPFSAVKPSRAEPDRLGLGSRWHVHCTQRGDIADPLAAGRVEVRVGIRELFQDYIETDDPLPITTIHRDLALHMEDSYFENEIGLNRLIWLFRFASVLLSAEVIAWIIDIAVRG